MGKSCSIFSFFSGSGFLDLGFELSGFNVVYASDYFSPFMRAYRYSREKLNLPLPKYGCHEGEQGNVVSYLEGLPKLQLADLLTDARKNVDIVGFIGGPPCPDFSVGGKNRGRDGNQGKLSEAYFELISQQKPDFFLFENVKGLWRTKKHREFFEELKQKAYQSGYILTERLINSIEFGVPQDRERIILLGFRAEVVGNIGIQLNNHKTLIQGRFPWLSQSLFLKEKVFSYPWPRINLFSENSSLNCPSEIPRELTAEHWFRINNVANHPNSKHHFKPQAGLNKFLSINEGDDSKKSFKRLHRWRYSPTVCYGNNEVHLHPYKARRLSVAESLALQSLPKNFSLPPELSLTNMFKTVGNGVPYLASKAIAQMIIQFLESPQNSYEILANEQLELPLV